MHLQNICSFFVVVVGHNKYVAIRLHLLIAPFTRKLKIADESEADEVFDIHALHKGIQYIDSRTHKQNDVNGKANCKQQNDGDMLVKFCSCTRFERNARQ